MAANCLAGCIADYRCDPMNVPGQGPGIVNSENASPIVKALFVGGSFEVLVGNESCPSFGHDACITSLEYGFVDGHKATIEILDIQGGIMSGLIDNLEKCMEKASNEEYSVKFTFGWGCR
jgi:hypothetical protein